jgi:serine/threonine-protein kinase RsbW
MPPALPDPRRPSLPFEAPHDAVFSKKYILSGDGSGAKDAQEEILRQAELHEFCQSSCFAVRLALEEALSNAFKHGSQLDPQRTVTVDCSMDQDAIAITIQDEGPGFDPGVVPDPTQEENIEIPSGRGLILMRSFMSDVEIEPPGNLIRMRYERPRASA